MPLETAGVSEVMGHMLGFCAAALTVGSGFPQVVRILRTRDVHAISLPLYVMLFSGVLLWLAYGITIHALPIIVSNAISASTSGLILLLKVRLSK